jgi:hypothetical protein
MNKEQIIDEVYNNYFIKKSVERGSFGISGLILSKEEFIDKCKTDSEFSEKWGLKIEERELSLEERMDLSREKRRTYWNWPYWSFEEMEWHLTNEWNIPTKLITLTYKDEKIEIYE